MVEIGLVVGYFGAWVLGKAKRVADRANAGMDAALDAGTDALVDRLQALITARLGTDPAVMKLQTEAERTGEITARTRQRVELALADEVENDEDFARDLAEVMAQLATRTGPRGAGIDLRGAQGVQIGDRNVQTNTFQ